MDKFRLLAEERESTLSPLAAKSVESKGRIFLEEQCKIRTVFERDSDRILYSVEFRRLRHKTQVFFNAKNDHICTRMEHVLYVASIAKTVASALGLNRDLTYAIALGHDLGHAPFGHTGEAVLDRCISRINPKKRFMHEVHSLRVADKLATKMFGGKINGRNGLNLTFEVRDGIVCHCGEKKEEYKLYCNREKSPDELNSVVAGTAMPATLEGCVVRIVDKIAYVGRDIEDAIRAGIMGKNDIPAAITEVLGKHNGDMINTLVYDLIENSYEKDYIALSTEKGQALSELLSINYDIIYKNNVISRYEKQAQNIVEGLFEYFMLSIEDSERLSFGKRKIDGVFNDFASGGEYDEKTPKEDIVVDFLAGMTDNYAMACFEELYWI